MKAFAVLALAGAAVAMPAAGAAAFEPCQGLQGNANCCGADVLGAADLNCDVPSRTPTSAADFQTICSEKGNQPMCCALPVLGQALLCVPPVGI